MLAAPPRFYQFENEIQWGKTLSKRFAQKMTIWVCKVIRIAAVRVWMSVDEQMFPGHGSSWAVSRPGVAARRRIIASSRP